MGAWRKNNDAKHAPKFGFEYTSRRKIGAAKHSERGMMSTIDTKIQIKQACRTLKKEKKYCPKERIKLKQVQREHVWIDPRGLRAHW